MVMHYSLFLFGYGRVALDYVKMWCGGTSLALFVDISYNPRASIERDTDRLRLYVTAFLNVIAAMPVTLAWMIPCMMDYAAAFDKTIEASTEIALHTEKHPAATGISNRYHGPPGPQE